MPLDITESYDLEQLGQRIAIDYGICSRCRFVCQRQALPTDALMRYYRDSPKLREPVPSETDCALYAQQAFFMGQAGELHGKRVLDVGADMGKLLDYLSSEFACTTFYQEENATARAWLEKQAKHAEYRQIAGDAPLDWIVLSQVLEHIIEPVAALSQFRRHLAPDGKLFVEVPNQGIWDDLDIPFVFEHVNYFSPATLVAVLDLAGFYPLLLTVTTDPHYFNGRCRIIRVCAQRRADAAVSNTAATIRDHHRSSKLTKFDAIDAMSRELMDTGKPGLAIYGAAVLADLLFTHTHVNKGNLAAIFDSDARKHGTDFGGLTVLPPDNILGVAPKAIVILSSAEADIRQTIQLLGYAGRVIGWSELV